MTIPISNHALLNLDAPVLPTYEVVAATILLMQIILIWGLGGKHYV